MWALGTNALSLYGGFISWLLAFSKQSGDEKREDDSGQVKIREQGKILLLFSHSSFACTIQANPKYVKN